MRRVSGPARLMALFILVAMLFAACGSTSGGGTTPTAAAPITVGIVADTGGLNDGGFNQFSHLGYENARKMYNFPDVVEVASTATTAEYVTKMKQEALVADMVIGIGFDMEPAIGILAKQYPNKEFAIVDGCASDANYNCLTPPPSNVAVLFFKEQEAGCLVGAIAGQMEVDGKAKAPKLLGHNTIGAVGGQSIPPVNRYIAGYKYCAKMVDPSVTMELGYSQNFSDPTQCSSIANKQINVNQADILFQVAGGCGNGVLDAADQHGVYSIGVDADQSKTSTGSLRPSVITSALKRVDTAVFTIIQKAEQQGKASTGAYSDFVTSANATTNPFRFDISNDGVGFATPSSQVPADAVAKAMQFEAEIKAGTLTPPENIPS